MQREDLIQLLGSVGIAIDEVIAAGDHAPLENYGMTSLTIVQLLLALEESIGVSFPDELLEKRYFETVATIKALICKLEDERRNRHTE